MFTFRGWIPRLMEIWKEHVTKPSGDSESRLQLLLLTIQILQCTDFNSAPLYGSMRSLKYYAEFFQKCWNPQMIGRTAQDISGLIQHLTPAPYAKLLLKHKVSHFTVAVTQRLTEWVCCELALKVPPGQKEILWDCLLTVMWLKDCSSAFSSIRKPPRLLA